jgi:hypothetical protein
MRLAILWRLGVTAENERKRCGAGWRYALHCLQVEYLHPFVLTRGSDQR